MKIKQILAREILDSRGIPTVEVTLHTDNDISLTASCPSGKSVSDYEALELRDKDQSRFQGNGVLKAVDNIGEKIAPKIIGMDVTAQGQIDKAMIELDGTNNKSSLGANAILPVSIAVAKAAAINAKLPPYKYLRQYVKNQGAEYKIPTPLFNLINGGAHAGKNIDMQEFMIVPASNKSYSESLQISFNVYRSLYKILKQYNLPILIGDEGGYGPPLATNEDALLMLSHAVSGSNLRLGYDVFLGIDAAATGFYNSGVYTIKDKKTPLMPQELATFYTMLIKKYNILYLEDPFAEDDWDGWIELSSKDKNTIITGDDLTSTNLYRLSTAIEKKAISGIIIKPNQIGSVIETLAVVEAAREAGLKITVSHRSGETNDDFIADLAVAVAADYCKFGAPARGERVAKYNRLLKIESELKGA